MPSEVALLDRSGQPVELPLELGEYRLREGKPGEGETRRLVLVNSGDTALKDISLELDGEGADVISLAIDADGQPGVWAAPGESITPTATSLLPGEQIAFYARATFAPEDVEQLYKFDLIIKATSLGD